MAIPHNFQDALNRRDIKMLRLLLGNSLNLDPTFRDFDEMQKQALDGVGPSLLYEQYDGGLLPEDKTQWDIKFLARELTSLSFNFCPERIEYIKEIITYQNPELHSRATSLNISGENAYKGSVHTVRPKNYRAEKEKDAKNGRIIKITGCAIGCGIAGAAIPMLLTTGKFTVGSMLGGSAGILVGLGIGMYMMKN